MTLLPMEIEEEEVEISPLSANENKRRAELEAVIDKNFKGFVQIGLALAEIRQSRLYRSTHRTFECYCADLWDMCKKRANQHIAATAVIMNLQNDHNCGQSYNIENKDENKKNGNHGSHFEYSLLPQNERQARPLTRLQPDQQKEVWQSIVMNAPEGKITASLVERAVRIFLGEERKEKKTEVRQRIAREEAMDLEVKRFFKDFFAIVDEAKHDKWKKTSKEAIIKYLDALRDIVVQEA